MKHTDISNFWYSALSCTKTTYWIGQWDSYISHSWWYWLTFSPFWGIVVLATLLSNAKIMRQAPIATMTVTWLLNYFSASEITGFICPVMQNIGTSFCEYTKQCKWYKFSILILEQAWVQCRYSRLISGLLPQTNFLIKIRPPYQTLSSTRSAHAYLFF